MPWFRKPFIPWTFLMIEPRFAVPFAMPLFAAAGLLLGNKALLFIAGALFFLIVFAWLLGTESTRRLDHKRSAHGRSFEKEKVAINFTLYNRGNVPLHAVRLTDYFLAQDMLPKKITAGADLPPRKSMNITYHPVCLRHRGEYSAGPLEVRFSDPFGLFLRRRLFSKQEKWTVMPVPLPLELSGFSGRNTLLSAATPDQRTRGESLKFFGLREYRSGDPLRFVDWKSTARLGELTVRQFEASVASQITIFLDLERKHLVGLGAESTIEYGIRAAASIAAASIAEDHEIQLYGEGERPLRVPLGRGDAHLGSLLEQLALLKPKGRRSLADLVAACSHLVPHGSKVFLIIASMSGDVRDYVRAVEMLRGRYAEITAIMIDDRTFLQHDKWRKDLDQDQWTPLFRCLVNRGVEVKCIEQGADIGRHLQEGAA